MNELVRIRFKVLPLVYGECPAAIRIIKVLPVCGECPAENHIMLPIVGETLTYTTQVRKTDLAHYVRTPALIITQSIYMYILSRHVTQTMTCTKVKRNVDKQFQLSE